MSKVSKQNKNSSKNDNPSSLVAKRFFTSSFDQRLLYKTITDEFKDWKPWQRCVLLCGCTERSSKQLLNTLSTVVEPLFHRTYEVASLGDYPANLIKHYINEVTQVQVQKRKQRKKKKSTNVQPSKVSVRPHSISLSTTDSVENPLAQAASSHLETIINEQLADNLNKAPSNKGNTKPGSSSSDGRKAVSPLHNKAASPLHNRDSDKSPSHLIPGSRGSNPNESNSTTPHQIPSNSQVRIATPDIILEKKCIDHSHVKLKGLRKTSSGNSLPKLDSCCFSQFSLDFNEEDEKPIYQGRTLHQIQKGWLPAIKKESLVKPTSALAKAYKTSLKNAMSRFSSWSNAEKGEFLLEVLELCSQQDLVFFAQCVLRRLKEANDINRLPDSLLLKIFDKLDSKSLLSTSHVCKRWYLLSKHQSLWKQWCFDLAERTGQIDSIKELCLHSNEDDIDWKMIYFELKEALALLEIEIPETTKKEKIKPNQEYKDNTKIETVPIEDEDVLKYVLGVNISKDISQEMHNTPSPENGLPTLSVPIGNKCSNLGAAQSLELQRYFDSDERNFADRKDDLGMSQDLDSEDDFVDPATGSEDDSDTKQLSDDNENMKEYTDGSLHMLAEQLNQVSNKTLGPSKNEMACDVRHELVQCVDQLEIKNEVKALPSQKELEYATVPIKGVKSLKRVRKLEGHREPVLCLQFDSKRIMTGSADRTVRMWDVRSGRNFHKLKGHKGGIRCIHFDDKYIITGSWDTTIMIWDVAALMPLTTLLQHTGCVSCIHADNDILVSGSHDKTVCIWQRDSWNVLHVLKGHLGAVLCLCLVSESQLLTGSVDKTIRLWDLDEFTELKVFDNGDSPVLTVKVCGQLIASGTTGGHIHFWDIHSGERQGILKAHEGAVYCLCFMRDKFITGGGDSLVKEWDLGTCTCIRSLSGHTGAVLCVRASSKRIVSGSADGSARIWDLECALQGTGDWYDEMNKNVIHSDVMTESQHKRHSKKTQLE